MAWLYGKAVREGTRVKVRLNEPTRDETHYMTLVKYASETEEQFIARGRAEIAQTLAGLDAQALNEQDVTNIFRP